MQENNNNDYLHIRRKHFLWVVFSLVLFGAILYFSSVVSDYAEKNDIENFEDAKDKVIAVLKHDFAIFPENDGTEDEKNEAGKEEKSKNILQAPLILNCSVENGKAVLKEPFEVAKHKVSNGVFELAGHGNTLYSTSFSSQENSVSCRGTMKEGQQKIFVYYCEKI